MNEAEKLINRLYGNIGFTCDSCGRETNGITYVNGMKFCAKCYQETFGKDNQLNELKTENKTLKEFADKLDEGFGKNVEPTLSEKADNIIALYRTNKKYCEMADEKIKELKCQLAEKTAKLEFANKEIERLKASNCYIHDLHNNLYREYQKKNDEFYKNQTQLAIQELEKVKNKCNRMYELWLDSNHKENMYNNEDIAGVFEDISVFTNDLIKKLKGEK